VYSKRVYKLNLYSVLLSDILVSDENVLPPDEIYEQLHQAAVATANDEPLPPVTNILASTCSVHHIPQQKVFTVSNSDGQVNAVRLFPKETCTCPASTTCGHILAAKRSVGMEQSSRKVLNLSKLRNNAR